MATLGRHGLKNAQPRGGSRSSLRFAAAPRPRSLAQHMAQITFFATDDDCDAIWRVIFVELHMTAYPDPWFDELPAPALTSQADVSENLADYPRVAPGLGYFLTSPEWSIEPLDYRLCENNPNFAPHWYVSQRYGGPSIHFIPRFGYPWHTETKQIISGMLSDYPYYYSAIDHRQIIERPAALVETMETIRQRLRSLGKIVRAPSGERAIAVSNALTARDAGQVLRTRDIIYSPVASRRRTRGWTRAGGS
jgi:hypothetical protein